MNEIMEKRGEGLVIKHPKAMYLLNGRNLDWIKVKPEYMVCKGDHVVPSGQLNVLRTTWERQLTFWSSVCLPARHSTRGTYLRQSLLQVDIMALENDRVASPLSFVHFSTTADNTRMTKSRYIVPLCELVLASLSPTTFGLEASPGNPGTQTIRQSFCRLRRSPARTIKGTYTLNRRSTFSF